MFATTEKIDQPVRQKRLKKDARTMDAVYCPACVGKELGPSLRVGRHLNR